MVVTVSPYGWFLFFWWGVFGFVLGCGGLCVFGGDSSLEGKFEGCWVLGFGCPLYFLDSCCLVFFLNAVLSRNEKPHSVKNGANGWGVGRCFSENWFDLTNHELHRYSNVPPYSMQFRNSLFLRSL